MPKRCFGCMKMKNQSPVCEHCGYNENVPNFPHQLPLGTVLKDQYLVGKVLGQGGFGITYMGWDLNLDVPVAIKEYFPNGFVNRECTRSLSVTCGDENRQLFQHNRERFIREARALAKLREVPGIVRIHNFFQENATAYIVMEYVEGIDLKRYIRMQGRTLSAAEVLHILKPVMEALSAVHGAELVHRDITPDNIMILPDGSAKLLDFGAVREVVDADADKNLSQATEAILKQGFAPMEQYQNRGSLGPWTDVYAMCATIYYCVTGRVPPDAPARLLEGKQLNWAAVPGLNQRQLAALEWGMALLPKDRIASMKALYNELYGLAPVPTPNPQPVLENDFRNAYNTPPSAPVQNYPNHTVPLEEAPPRYEDISRQQPGGYSNYAPPQPVRPTPPKPAPVKKKSKLPLILGAAAAVVAGVIALGSIGSSGSNVPAPAAPKKQDEIPKKLSQPSHDLDQILDDGPDYTYDYRHGGQLELYFDNNDLERCRIYYDENGKMAYKFVAEYNEYGDMLKHWVYDGKETLIRTDEYTYDSEGDVQSYVFKLADGTILEQTEHHYNAKGNHTESITKAGDGTVLRKNAYTYDNQGKQVSSVYTYKDGTYIEFTYNENEDTETQHNYDENGKLERYYLYEYDADGTRTSTRSYLADGTLDTYSNPVYNPDDKIVKDTWYNADGTLSYTMTYQYIGGQVMIGNVYESGTYRSESETVKDLMGNYLIDFDYFSGDYSNGYSINTYNDFGDSLERLSYDNDGTLSYVSLYDYDEHGNSLGYTYTYYSDDGSYDESIYNEDGNLVTRKCYDANGTLESWTESEFAADGTRTKQFTYQANGFMSNMEEYQYDANGEMTLRTHTSYNEDGSYSITVTDGDYNTLTMTGYKADGSVNYIRKYEYKFNANGKKDKAYVYDENGELQYWTEYFYDENGNYKDSETHFV